MFKHETISLKDVTVGRMIGKQKVMRILIHGQDTLNDFAGDSLGQFAKKMREELESK